jgi:anthranilate synthase component I
MNETGHYYPPREHFLKLAGENEIVPVYCNIVADLETPVSVYAKLFKESCSCLLESVEGTARLSRYSFIAGDPFLTLKANGECVEILKEGQATEEKRDLIATLREILSQYKAAEIPGLPRFYGGVLGYFGYDSLRPSGTISYKPQEEQEPPDAFLIFPESVIVFDHYTSRLKIIINTRPGRDPAASYAKAVVKIEQIIKSIRNNSCAVLQHSQKRGRNKAVFSVKSNISRPEFLKKVKKIKNHIKYGNILQVVLSQRFESRQKNIDSFEVYRALRSLNPSPYMYYLNFGKTKIVGASPEMLVRLEEGVVETRPIAGTRPRGETLELDRELEVELSNDPKERAEHTMLVELGKSDLERVSISGSVEVPVFMSCDRYSHVMHLVSEVKGRLREDKDAFDALLACFPAGTVSGAPRAEAMEIIDQLEPTKRGPYAGAVGYVSFAGNMDTCITIRTIVFVNGKAYAQAGAGIVTDSQPEREYEETLNKAQVLLEALKIAGEDSENDSYRSDRFYSVTK